MTLGLSVFAVIVCFRMEDRFQGGIDSKSGPCLTAPEQEKIICNL